MTEILNSKTIGIIGLNGGGSHFIQQFSNIGFMNYVLCDPGFIDDKKLNRNVLATKEHARLNASKVDVATERILSLNEHAHIIPVKSKWQIGAELGKFNTCDIIVGAVDSFQERDQIERYSRELRIPYIDIGMDIKTIKNNYHVIYGQAIMTFPDGPCMRCLGFLNERILELEVNNYGDAGDKPQVVWPNGCLASTAVSFLMNYFFQWSGNYPPYLYRQYDGNNFTITDHEHAKRMVESLKCGCKHF